MFAIKLCFSGFVVDREPQTHETIFTVYDKGSVFVDGNDVPTDTVLKIIICLTFG